MAPLPKIASLWIGGQLSWLEQLCLRSFAAAGHHTTLYSYEEINNLPDGVHSADAREIYDPSRIVAHARTGSPAIHADIWRLHLIAQTDAIWVDADMYCYRPFNFETQHVFGFERPDLVCNAVLGMPADSPALKALLGFFEDAIDGPAEANRTPVENRRWGFTGPHALTRALEWSGELKHALNVEFFYRIPFKDRNRVLFERFDVEGDLTENTRGVHFWARRLKPRMARRENNRPEPASFLGRLIEKHGIDPDSATLPGWRPNMSQAVLLEGAGRSVTYLLDTLRTDRLTRVVDVGANPVHVPPYRPLFDMAGCEVIGFEPHPEAYENLTREASDLETYFPYAIGDGSVETLNIYRAGGLTSIYTAYEPAFTYLGRSRKNMTLVESVEIETRRLDDLDDVPEFDLLKIDIQGGEVKALSGGEARMRKAIAVVIEVRFYPLYEGEPMFGGVDAKLRELGFQLHKITEPKGKVIPNSQIGRLKRFRHRNQIIDADAIYIRDLGKLEDYSDEDLKHLAILSASVFESHDVALYCLDELVRRDSVAREAPKRYVDRLPKELKK